MAFELKYKFIYEGEEADANRLPAHLGATSLEGLTWSISLIAHYAATGKIRSRGDLSDKIQVYIRPAKQGSYITELVAFITEPQNIFITSVIGAYSVNTIGTCLNGLVVKTIKEVCGLVHQHTRHDEKWTSRLPSGDQEALADKIEPSMRRAHDVIGQGASTLDIQKGRTPLIQLDINTKAYVNADFVGEESTDKVSVGAFNANTGNGRVFLPSIGKTVPFSLGKEVDRNTKAILSSSLDKYVNSLPSLIDLTNTPILTADGRIKKLIVGSARNPNN